MRTSLEQRCLQTKGFKLIQTNYCREIIKVATSALELQVTLTWKAKNVCNAEHMGLPTITKDSENAYQTC